jgi:hypothetical protein
MKQEDCELKPSLRYRGRSCLKKNKQQLGMGMSHASNPSHLEGGRQRKKGSGKSRSSKMKAGVVAHIYTPSYRRSSPRPVWAKETQFEK